MENTIIKEGTDILKKLSPKNQDYLMTMLRLAEAGEDGARSEMRNQFRNPPQKTL